MLMQSTAQTNNWIQPLVEMALPQTSGATIIKKMCKHQAIHDISSSYSYCDKVTAYHSKSFFLASSLLPSSKKKAIRALYAFCRTTDDIVDVGHNDQSDHLNRWRSDATSNSFRLNDPVAIAWGDTRKKFCIPSKYAQQLMDGVEMDIHKNRYRDFDELSHYCYGVASTVGLMSMHIIGYTSTDAIPYAIKLGVALQLTNILRDVGEDWRKGRIYLPADEMEQYDITEDHFREKRVDEKWKTFMNFQIERARRLYSEAWPGILKLHPDGRLAIAAAATFYKRILHKIEANDYDNFTKRAVVSKWEKLSLIPPLIFNHRLFQKSTS